MDLRQLRYFVAIAEAGSLSAAAGTIGIAQSALSRHLQCLEQAVGARLLDRGRRGVVPTEAGTLLLARGRAILEEIEATRAELASGAGRLRGTVDIATSSTVADVLYGPLALRFARAHPDVHLNFHEGQDDLVSRLAQGRLDLAIVTTSDRTDLVSFRPLYAEAVWLIGLPGDPLLGGAPIALEQVLTRELILPVGEASLHWLHAESRLLGLTPRCRLHAESLGTIRELVHLGLGCALLPYSAMCAELAAGRFAGAEIRGFELVRKLGTPRGRAPSRAARVVAEAIGAEIGRLVDGGQIERARLIPIGPQTE
ncbi:MAG: LysR family transcriptional regulator [Proteobacteria bacterium]|nr:LysR family transcriptional regulator [Pseudomonadota bacterium]